MSQNRKGGIIELTMNGERYDAKGAFTYNLGKPQREAIIGGDEVHGFKETPQVAFIEGAITDNKNLDLAKLVTAEDMTAVLRLANGKSVVLNNGWYAGEGSGNTEEGEIGVRIEGRRAEEIN
ncbi:phage tail tube protein [Sansalvadorimonas verongulae]|uniref:phage tail tube protein n=1 Tax=Sansalvadorimonas verongulae TaxID=2172824 RepID=UPI0012BD42E9|nr:phage tail tube protein [Sansalvadorimonas verongulae]MTI13363.1 phage tail protein [Sansalvadorimonas verongulae]